MTHLLAFAVGLAAGVYLGLRHDREPATEPWTRVVQPMGDEVTVSATGPDGTITVRGHIVPDPNLPAWRPWADPVTEPAPSDRPAEATLAFRRMPNRRKWFDPQHEHEFGSPLSDGSPRRYCLYCAFPNPASDPATSSAWREYERVDSV